MSFLDTIIGRLAPHNCLGCGAEGSLTCKTCEQKLAPARPRCYRCQRPLPDFLTCRSCLRLTPLIRVLPAVLYEDLAKQLIAGLKFHGAQAATRSMTAAFPLDLLHSRFRYIVPVPTATTRTRRRGYDQAKLLARELSRQTGIPYLDCLARHGRTHQVGASREQRLVQLAAAFRVKHAHLVRGSYMLLVDDVITTGASLEAAALALSRHGAAPIEAAVFAQA